MAPKDDAEIQALKHEAHRLLVDAHQAAMEFKGVEAEAARQDAVEIKAQIALLKSREIGILKSRSSELTAHVSRISKAAAERLDARKEATKRMSNAVSALDRDLVHFGDKESV